MSLIIAIIVLGIVYWAISLIPLPHPFPVIIKVIFILMAVGMFLEAMGYHTGLPSFRL